MILLERKINIKKQKYSVRSCSLSLPEKDNCPVNINFEFF